MEHYYSAAPSGWDDPANNEVPPPYMHTGTDHQDYHQGPAVNRGDSFVSPAMFVWDTKETSCVWFFVSKRKQEVTFWSSVNLNILSLILTLMGTLMGKTNMHVCYMAVWIASSCQECV